MATQYQGFDIVLNLSESDLPESDRNIINNLGGGNIAADLLTFYNNMRNYSELVVSSGDISGNTIIKNDAQFVFTTGTKITVGSTTYYVKDSDGKTSFKLSTLANLSTTVSNPPTGSYRRSDAVTLENITNLAVDRPRTVQDFAGSRLYENLSDLTDEELYKLNTSLIAMINAVRGTNFPTEISEYISRIEAAFDQYEQTANKVIVRDDGFVGVTPVQFNGVVNVVDTANTNGSSLPPSSNPGVFIVNPKTGVYARAFSSNENVWEKDGSSNLVVDATSLIIGDLSFTGTNGINLLSKGASVLVEDVTPSANLVFTHYVDITVNGESYSLCLFT